MRRDFPSISKRRIHRPVFKARVATEAISGEMTLREIVVYHAIQLSQWK